MLHERLAELHRRTRLRVVNVDYLIAIITGAITRGDNLTDFFTAAQMCRLGRLSLKR